MKNKELEMYFVCFILLVISFSAMAWLEPRTFFTGNIILEEIEIENKFEYVPPEDFSTEATLDALLQTEDELKDMKSFNLSTYLINDLLIQAKRNFIGNSSEDLYERYEKIKDKKKKDYTFTLISLFESTLEPELIPRNYTEVFRITQLISFKKQQAYDLIDAIALTEEKEQEYKKRKVDTSLGLRILEEAKKAFEEERYDESEAYLNEANIKLDKASAEFIRFKGAIDKSKNFIQRYWWQVLLVLVIIIILSPFVVIFIRKKLARKKLNSLRLELETIKKLIKEAQEDCFKTKKITLETYKIRAAKYKDKMTKIKHTIPILEAIVYGEKKREKKKIKKKQGILEVKK